MEKREIKYIYWFAYYNLDSPSVRYRAKYPLKYAKDNLGIESCLIIPGYSPIRILKFIKAFISAILFPKDSFLIVIQRVHSNFIYSNLLKLLVKIRKDQTVYDLDDAEYLEHDAKTIHWFARNCNHVSAGSEEIATYISRYNQNVIHVTSPTPDYGIVKQERNKTFTIGWIGAFGWGHKDSLYKYVLPAIKDLPFECIFILIGVINISDEREIKEYFKESNHIQIKIPKEINWNDELDLQERIKQFDVGIATLLNHPLQLSKSGIKAKQYMNNGVPVLCNNLPENNKVVISSYNGFICNNESEFKKRLIQFNEMTSDEYRGYSKNARHSIENFNHFKYFENFEIIKNGTQSSRRSRLRRDAPLTFIRRNEMKEDHPAIGGTVRKPSSNNSFHLFG